jgi:AcrR family transcriptional regulator
VLRPAGNHVYRTRLRFGSHDRSRYDGAVPAPRQTGLRERKKLQTRQRMITEARRLFSERGYEGTPLSDIADAADVSVGTIFGYFTNKSEIFFAGYDEIVDSYVDALRMRPAGQDAIEATIAWHEAQTVRYIAAGSQTPEAIWRLELRRIVDSDENLRAMERLRYIRAEAALAEALADDFGNQPGDLRPHLIAAMHTALMFTMALRARSNMATDWTTIRAYADACLRAAATAIAEVSIPAASKPRRRTKAASAAR